MELSFSIIIVLLVASLDLILGGIILAQNPKDKTNISYAFFALTVALWGFGVGFFLSITDVMMTDFLARLLYFAGGSIPTSFLLFSLVFGESKKLSKKILSLIFLPSIFFIYLYFFSDLIIKGVSFQNSTKTFEYGPLSYLFDIHLWGYFLITFIVFIKKYLSQKDKSTKQHTLFVILGTYSVLAVAGVSNTIAPRIDIFDLIWIGPSATLIWIVVVAYAVAKYQLFNMRIIIAELLIISLWVFLLIRIFFSTGKQDFWINSGSFLIVLLLGFYLIRGVIKEVKSRERIEKLAKELGKANVKLKELDRLKSEFVSIASHQLRSPLTAMKGYASMLLEGSYGEFPEKAKEAVSRIFESTNLMVASVEDFLNVSRIEQGKMKYDKTDFDVSKLVKTVVDELTPVATKKELTLSFKSGEEGPIMINADLGKIKQVFNNLIDNSIKYTPKGSVTVSISTNGGSIRFDVSDTGIGLSEETIEKLFDKFVRAGNGHKVNVTGSGLGLYVAKQMVEAHGGKVWAESEGEGKGSSFIVELKSN